MEKDPLAQPVKNMSAANNEKGNRFCQIVFHKIENHPILREVDKFEDKTDKGEGSFDSTSK